MKRNSLSVIMPNYNYGQYIGEALEAILSQSYQPDEIIVVDDASTDNSIEVIERFMKEHPKIKLIRNKVNAGINYTYNFGLSSATGDYFYCAGSDDKVLPGFFERSMDQLSKHPEAGLSSADNVLMDSCGFIEDRPGYSDKPRYFSPDEVVRLALKRNYTVCTSNTVIFKRSALLEAGGYIPECGYSSDSFASTVVSFRHGICYIPEVLAMMRVHPLQHGRAGSGDLKAERQVIRNMLTLLEDPRFSDVAPMFKRAAPLSSYPFEAMRVVAGDKRYWSYISFKLARFALFDVFKRALKRVISKRAYYAFAGTCKRVRRIFK